jgi:serine/threonine protein phosphatase PrpC
MIVKSAGKSDIGLVRAINEDSYKVLPERDLYIVCDGMGGHNAGEIASSMACEITTALYGYHFEELLKDERLRLPRMFPPSTDVLVKSVRIANRWIQKKASSQTSLSGMGTTIVAVAIESDIITILHVGDSRVYCFSGKKLIPLTRDHSWAAEIQHTEKISEAEAKQLVNRNVITRALGVKEAAEIDVAIRKLSEGEIYILCSDGLCGFVEDKDIEAAVADCMENPDKIVSDLIAMANQRGGSDNVSVVAFKIVGKVPPSPLPELEPVTVDGEPQDYFGAEEEWATLTAEQRLDVPKDSADQGSKGARFAAAAFILIIVAVMIYFMVKG